MIREAKRMPASIESHAPDCQCNACKGRRQGGRSQTKVTAWMDHELAAWVADQGGPTFLRRLVKAAREEREILEMVDETVPPEDPPSKKPAALNARKRSV